MQPDPWAALEALRNNRTDDALSGLRTFAAEEYEGLAVAIADEAISLIQAGLIPDAIRRLECFTSPKWRSPVDCEQRYRAAMREWPNILFSTYSVIS